MSRDCTPDPNGVVGVLRGMALPREMELLDLEQFEANKTLKSPSRKLNKKKHSSKRNGVDGNEVSIKRCHSLPEAVSKVSIKLLSEFGAAVDARCIRGVSYQCARKWHEVKCVAACVAQL